MCKFNYKNPAVLSAREARKLGVQIADTPDMVLGMKKGKDGVSRIHIMPSDFVIDRFNHIVLDISHVAYKQKVH